jgi:hypothetical protein
MVPVPAAAIEPVPALLAATGWATATEIPDTEIGVVTGAFTVVSLLLGAAATVVLLGQPDDGVARIATLMPQTVTGAVTGALAEIGNTSATRVLTADWAGGAGGVVSAEAIPVPTSQRPPATTAH